MSLDDLTQRQLTAVEAMIFAMPAVAVRELERALRAGLAVPAPPLREGRKASLGHLAMMVAEDLAQRGPEDLRPPRVSRKDYDGSRPDGASRSAVLVRKYGSWVAACASAKAVAAEGRGAAGGGGKAWHTPETGGRRGRDFTREEVIDGVIEVAYKLDRDPYELSSTAYYRYVAEMRRRARANGATLPRWATQRSVERFFRSWHEVRRAVRSALRQRPVLSQPLEHGQRRLQLLPPVASDG